MCGIFAIFAPPGERLPQDADQRVARALRGIRHRGPDASGVHVDVQGRWAVGHVRLSVIDVAASSNQPFWSACGSKFVVFNGEIYNYLELRADLEREGATFRTHSDTEVLLQALIHWGTECIDRFNGMWSFVYGDATTGSFVICRDRWGVKPLYTMVHHGMLLVCSEAKGLFAFTGAVPSPDLTSIGLFLKYSIGGESPASWFAGVSRFPKGVFWQFDLRTLSVGRARARTNYSLATHHLNSLRV
jgi:asparagine synthase (glutamine-hydrolysing)